MAIRNDAGLTRREMLKRGAAAMAAGPMIVSASALGKSGHVAPSDRITLGLIGCGNHGVGWNLKQIFRYPDVQVVAVCDVDRHRVEPAKAMVDRQYSKAFGTDYKGCKAYGDFREVIRRKDIDAIANCTPDHWHVIPAIMAARMGKDVICEKPLTLTIAEGRTLVDAVAKSSRIFQTASENRSIDTYIQLCEIVRAGRIGKLRHIDVTLPGGNESRGDNFTQREVCPPPEGFDYDMWLGQAPVAPYCPARCHGSFRWFRDYSGGRLTDWGAHLIDLAQWGHDTEATGPVAVEGEGKFPPKDELFDTAYAFDLTYRYADGVTMRVRTEEPGVRFEGSDGWIGFRGWRGPLEASDEAMLKEPIKPEEQLYRPSEIVPRRAGGRGGEYRNFLDCVKSRRPCYAPAETGHRTVSIAHIGNIAMLLGRKLAWDPARERFVNDTEADAMLSRKQRDPWTIANIDKWIAG
jgi:predicted dehydrogenase